MYWLQIIGAATCCGVVAAYRHQPYWHGGDASLIALTSNGPILGHPAPKTTSVVEYLGIPYAEPPTGDLRFAPAQPYSGHDFQNASAFGYNCPAPMNGQSKYPNLTSQAQMILNNFLGDANPDEDCLTLNIWKPRRSQRGGLAVFVHFYGGRFTTGNSATPFYYGYDFAGSQDIIVVTTNFRANIFGFPGVPGQPQNLGLRDQRLAVEWVQRNIKAFGGDPDKIVIAGQSAGAVAVDYWAYAYAKDPIVKGFISHSGNALSFPVIDAAALQRNWYNVSAQLGCGSSGDTLPCMRTKRWQDIEAASQKLPAVPSGSPLRTLSPFYPSPDNVTVFSDYVSLSNAGAFARLPYLVGNCNYEQGLYALLAFDRNKVTTTEIQGAEFLLSSFTCPNDFEATNRHKYGVPVWLFRYFGTWANLELYSGSGAYHGADVDILFGNDGLVSGIPPSLPEAQTTDLMQKAWAAFIRDPVNGLTRLGWPSFDPASDSLIRIAYNNQPEATFVSPDVYAGSCGNVTLAGAV